MRINMNKRNFLTILLLVAALAITSVLYANGPNFNRGRAQYVHKNYDKAKEHFLKGLAVGERGDTYFFLGEIEKIQGNFTEAEKYYTLALTVKTTPKYLSNAYWNLVLIAEQRGDTQALARICKTMWKRNNDNSAKEKIDQLINKLVWTDNQAAITKYNQALSAKSTDPAKSIQLLTEAMELAGDFIAAQFEKAMLLSASNQTDEAKTLFEDITTKIPIYASAHIAFANLLYDEGDYETSITHYNKALEFGFLSRDTEFLILSKLSQSYLAMENFTDAINTSIQASRLRPSDIPTLLFQSSIYIRQRDLDSAMKTLTSAEKIDSKNPDVTLQIGSIHFRNKDPKYIQSFDKLADLIIANPRIGCRKYSQALNLLMKAHFDAEKYTRIRAIAPHIKDCLSDEIISMLTKLEQEDNSNKKEDNKDNKDNKSEQTTQ